MALKKTLHSVCAAALATMFLVGCGNNDTTDITEYIETLKAAKIQSAAKNAVDKSALPVPATFEATSARSPFEGRKNLSTRKAATASNPLQAYPLSMLRFVGTVSDKDKRFAFILAPDNMIYQVKQDDSIGDRDGKVVEIKETEVVVKERSVEESGASAEQVVTLQLREEH